MKILDIFIDSKHSHETKIPDFCTVTLKIQNGEIIQLEAKATEKPRQNLKKMVQCK